jgi:hypothetical protein
MAQHTKVLLIDDLDGSDAEASGGRSSSSAGGRRRSAGSRSASNTSDVRSWARSHGYSVNDRGRVASEVLAAYEAAH